MCKFFFSYNHGNSKKLLSDFLLHGNEEHLEYGYGIGWQRDVQRDVQRVMKQESKWKTYKCNCFHMTDPKSQKVLDKIDSNVIVAHIRNIYHENMTPKQIADELNPHNVHPFTYGDAIFMHHGDLFMDYNNELNAFQLNRQASQFKRAISSVMKIVLPKFKKLIGKTDSELMFYLLLSIQQSLIDSNKSTLDAALAQSFYILNNIMTDAGISNSSNIFFSTGDYIAVAKIYKNNSKHEMKSPKFFYSRDRHGGILFSNVKLVPNVKDVEQNTLYIINTKTNNMCVYRL